MKLLLFVVLVFVPLAAASPLQEEDSSVSTERSELRELRPPAIVARTEALKVERPSWLSSGRRGLQSVISYFGLPGGLPGSSDLYGGLHHG